MKIYVVNDKDFKKLISDIELIKHRQVEFLGPHDPKRSQIDDIFRSFHLHVVNWVQDMQK